MGYWISKEVMKKIKSAFLYFGFSAGLLLTTAFQCWIYSTPSDYSIRYADVGILVTSTFLFEIIRRKKESSESKKQKAITYISKISFAIYFVHICVMTGINAITDNYIHVTGYFEFSILSALSFVISIMVIWIFSKNRIMKQYLFLIKD